MSHESAKTSSPDSKNKPTKLSRPSGAGSQSTKASDTPDLRTISPDRWNELGQFVGHLQDQGVIEPTTASPDRKPFAPDSPEPSDQPSSNTPAAD